MKILLINLFCLVILLFSCGSSEVPSMKLNVDQCEYCRMKISDGRFGAALTTQKGRTYKFDDLICLLNYKNENKNVNYLQFYISDFIQSNTMIQVDQAYFVEGSQIVGPMQGHIAAFANRDSALIFQKKYEAKLMNWEEVSH